MTTKAIVRKVVDVVPGQSNGANGKAADWKQWSLKRERYLTPEEVEKLLDAARRMPDPRIWMLCYVTANTGGRTAEVLNMKAGDIHPTEPIVQLVTMKRHGRPIRELRLPDNVAETIREWTRRYRMQPGDYLFQGRQSRGRPLSKNRAAQLFTLVAASAGLKVWSAPGRKGNGLHALRHANALAWMDKLQKIPGKSPLDMLLTIGQRLGHSSLRSTLTYLHPSQDAESVSAVGEFGKRKGPERLPAPPPPPPARPPEPRAIIPAELRAEAARPERLPAEVREVFAAVADAFGLDVTDLSSTKQTRRLSVARGVASFAVVEILGPHYTATEAGQFLDKDHSTILGAVKRIRELLKARDQLVTMAVGKVRDVIEEIREASARRKDRRPLQPAGANCAIVP